jgi:MFS family permease
MTKSFPFYYGWINVWMAALAMTATLPGRTHGLGLILKPLLEDLTISESNFAVVNLWSTLLGATFAIPMGLLIDRFGVRWMSVTVLAGLSLSVFWMSQVSSDLELFFCLTLIRGFGQSALSTVSIAMVSKWFRGRLAMAMGLFAVLLTFGFVGTVLGVGWAVGEFGWRSAWQMIAWSLFGSIPFFWLLVRSSPEADNVLPDREVTANPSEPTDSVDGTWRDYTLRESLRSPAFWIVALATSTFNLVWSSITLFNEAILKELGFGQSSAVEMMAYLTGMGLISNLIAGKLVTRKHIGHLLGGGMLAMGLALVLFPQIDSMLQLRIYGAAMGLVGGIITVVHFAAWGQLFGRQAIGSIQGVAQVTTVIASAIGPVCVANYADFKSTHLPTFYGMAALAITMAVASFLLQVPERLRADSK